MAKNIELDSTMRSIAVERFIEALKAAPDVLKRGLTGEEFAKEIVDGARLIAEFIYDEN